MLGRGAMLCRVCVPSGWGFSLMQAPYSKFVKEKQRANRRVMLDHMEPASRSPSLREKFVNISPKGNKEVEIEDQEEASDTAELESQLAEVSPEQMKKELLEEGADEEIADQIASNEFKELVDHFDKRSEDLKKRAVDVMMNNKYYRRYDIEVEEKFAELNLHYRSKYENITGDVYQKYADDYDKIRETLEAKYIKKTREYSARIAFRKALMRRYPRMRVLKKLKSTVERQRFYGTSIKWNWVIRKKFVDWVAEGRKAERLGGNPEEKTLHQRIRNKMFENDEEKKLIKEKKKKKSKPKTYKGPFYEMSRMGYMDHDFYSTPSEFDTQLATISKE